MLGRIRIGSKLPSQLRGISTDSGPSSDGPGLARLSRLPLRWLRITIPAPALGLIPEDFIAPFVIERASAEPGHLPMICIDLVKLRSCSVSCLCWLNSSVFDQGWRFLDG